MRSLPVEELQPGMILARSIINDEMMVILSEGTLLSKAHITRLAFLDVPFVYVKDEYELSEAFQNVSALFDDGSAFVSEYKDVIHEARSIFEEAKTSGKAPVEKSKEVVQGTITPMTKQSGVMDYLLEVNHLATDVYNHSVRVSIISGVLAKWMHLPKKETQDAILAGFLHEEVGSNHTTIANDVELAFVEDATRNGPQHKLLTFKDDGVSRIRAACIPCNYVISRSENIHDLTFTFVAENDAQKCIYFTFSHISYYLISYLIVPSSSSLPLACSVPDISDTARASRAACPRWQNSGHAGSEVPSLPCLSRPS